ncbi:FAD-dependent oxidoreductase [Kitasatospora sp. NPDC002227]|uniref:NAD(P)/FAD-dependent oxidoreductase n=1 Tax=Kitasatospora sp. NPDC002227 TaxID=3154773 RepID=UPI003317365A
MARVVVVGGGIGGLAAGLVLARRGHRVAVLEREARCAGSELDADFADWHRPGVPQAVQPHVLLGPVREVLRGAAPDVLAAMLRLGAQERNELADFAPDEQLPDDEGLVTIRARRIVLESALVAAVRAEPGVDFRPGTEVTGLLTRPGPVPVVTGVATAAGALDADLVVDAGGRRSPVPGWLAAAGARPVLVETQRTGIAYFCRWYRRRPGNTAPEPTGLGSAAPFANCRVFPADNGHFAVALTVSVQDPLRARLREPAVFDRVAAAFPGVTPWLALDHEAVTPVHVMAGIENRWTSLVDEHGPQAAGLLALGDSAVHTNPTLGQGIPLAFLAVEWLAGQDLADQELPAAYHRWRLARLRPWFDAQVAMDQAGQEALRSGVAGVPKPRPSGEALLRAATLPCGREESAVARVRAQIRHFRRPAAELLADPEVRDRVTAWLRANPAFQGGPAGPDRDRFEALIDS